MAAKKEIVVDDDACTVTLNDLKIKSGSADEYLATTVVLRLP